MSLPNPWHIAKQLVQEHGIDASVYAHMQALPFFEAGDWEMLDFWKHVIDNIDELRRVLLRPGEVLH